jgi:hypothetical protein
MGKYEETNNLRHEFSKRVGPQPLNRVKVFR